MSIEVVCKFLEPSDGEFGLDGKVRLLSIMAGMSKSTRPSPPEHQSIDLKDGDGGDVLYSFHMEWKAWGPWDLFSHIPYPGIVFENGIYADDSFYNGFQSLTILCQIG